MNPQLWTIVSRFASVTSLIGVILLIWRAGAWQREIEMNQNHSKEMAMSTHAKIQAMDKDLQRLLIDVAKNAEEDLKHHGHAGLHMPLEDKIEFFITRREHIEAMNVIKEQREQDRLTDGRRWDEFIARISRMEDKLDEALKERH